jgi:hypothetical protein
MAVGQIVLGGTSYKMFTFYNISAVNGWELKSPAINLQYFPAVLRPYAFDGVSREESFTFDAIFIPSTYDSADPGTGTFTDQLCDLSYLYRYQGKLIRAGDTNTSNNGAATSNPYLTFTIAFATGTELNTSHNSTRLGSLAEMGFTANSATYTIPCIIENFQIKEIDPIQRRVKVAVTIKRVKQVVSYG